MSRQKQHVGKPEGKRMSGKLRHRWEDNINMNLKETRWEGVDSITQGRIHWQAVVNLQVS
jgi:hypothetical protein